MYAFKFSGNYNVKLISTTLSILALTLAAQTTAIAGQAISWNLSRDMMAGITTNPKKEWTFMHNASGIHNPVNYTLLASYSKACIGENNLGVNFLNCWQDLPNAQFSLIGTATKTFTQGITQTRGVPLLHPDLNNQAVLRWKSPISGNITILGRISDIDSRCGNGISWSLDKGTTTLDSGILDNGSGISFLQQNISVTKGTSLYIIVDANGDQHCDSTNLDLIITSQQ